MSPARTKRPARGKRPVTKGSSVGTPTVVHLLDVGDNAYGDSLLCLVAGKSVLIDGAHPENHATRGIHPAIPDQIGQVLGAAAAPYNVDLLVVSHNHADHIGCLPKLVADGTLTATWAFVVDPDRRWGTIVDVAVSDAARDVANALQEEVQPPAADAASLERFISDAAALEPAYREMLATLEIAGTKVVRHGTDNPAALLQAFKPIGLKILGPTKNQLDITQRLLAGVTAATAVAADGLLRQDARMGPAEIYRALAFSRAGDAILSDAQSGGAAVNLQSSVLVLEINGRKLLFNGDMQLASTGSADAGLQREVDGLRAAIEAEGPFAFFKLSHHGSDNGMDADLFAGIGDTRWFGICAGEKSPAHPNPSILRLLAGAGQVHWARTDHNGLSSIRLGARPKITVSRGVQDDTSAPGDASARVAVTQGRPLARPGAAPVVVSGVPETTGTVEVVVRAPVGAGRTRVTVEIEQDPGARVGPKADRLSATESPVMELPTLHLAGGRALPRLLFVTNADGLANNIGISEAAAAIDAIHAAGHPIVTALASSGTWEQTLAKLAQSLPSIDGINGVVLLGGYDIVASQRLDTVPSALRARLQSGDPYDDFTVWSDEAYGDLRGGDAPRLPVSRIPDGRSAALVFAALSAAASTASAPRTGIRNKLRPFADGVFELLPGSAALGISEPLLDTSGFPLDAQRTYFMLHGDYADGSRFKGENDRRAQPVAFTVRNVPAAAPDVVFAGCCWGALTVDQRAIDPAPAGVPSPKAVDASIALRFLANGAGAFVGCTGAHYSPDEPPYAFFGGPLHHAFWEAHIAGQPSAAALLTAKARYAKAMFHGLTDSVDQAIEYKTLHQFTCLGLGW